MAVPHHLADVLILLGLALSVAVLVGVTTWAVPEQAVVLLVVLALVCLGVGSTLGADEPGRRDPRSR